MGKRTKPKNEKLRILDEKFRPFPFRFVSFHFCFGTTVQPTWSHHHLNFHMVDTVNRFIIHSLFIFPLLLLISQFEKRKMKKRKNFYTFVFIIVQNIYIYMKKWKEENHSPIFIIICIPFHYPISIPHQASAALSLYAHSHNNKIQIIYTFCPFGFSFFYVNLLDWALLRYPLLCSLIISSFWSSDWLDGC